MGVQMQGTIGETYLVWLPRAESCPFSFQNWTRVYASVLPTAPTLVNL